MKRISFLLVVVFVNVMQAAVPWSEELWLDGGDYWRERLVLEFENPTDNVWTGRTVAVSAAALGLEQTQLRELRLTDARGKHFRLGRAVAELYTYLQMLQKMAKGGTPSAAEACAVLEEYRRLAIIPNAGGCLSTRLLHNDPQVLDRLRARAGALLDGAAVTPR